MVPLPAAWSGWTVRWHWSWSQELKEVAAGRPIQDVKPSLIIVLVVLGSVRSAALESDDLQGQVAALAADEVVGNAMRALRVLHQAGSEAEAPLRAALRSGDWQQRQLAGHLLRRRAAQPSAALLGVSIEALRDDWSFYGDGRPQGPNLLLANARSALFYLAAQAEQGTGELRACLSSDDAQQRFLAAVLLGLRGDGQEVERCCAILLPHLAANDLPDDASLALAALHGLGAPVQARLARLQRPLDSQARAAWEWLERPLAERPERLAVICRRHAIGLHGGVRLCWRDFNRRAPAPLGAAAPDR